MQHRTRPDRAKGVHECPARSRVRGGGAHDLRGESLHPGGVAVGLSEIISVSRLIVSVSRLILLTFPTVSRLIVVLYRDGAAPT